MYRKKDLVNTSYLFVDRATPHCSKITRIFLDTNKDTISQTGIFSSLLLVLLTEFNAVEECWRQEGKYYILSNYYSN